MKIPLKASISFLASYFQAILEGIQTGLICNTFKPLIAFYFTISDKCFNLHFQSPPSSCENPEMLNY